MEETLAGGNVNIVSRVGDTVHRPTGPWTAAVHALLDHLAAKGFPYSPRAHGLDERGREVLDFVPGDVAMRPWPEVLLGDEGVREVARALRELAEATADFTPPPGAVWRTDALPAPGGGVRHGDLGPWNTVWDGDRLAGVIDWDFAEPAPPLWDLAQAAWYFVPLRPGWEASGFTAEPDRRHRLRVMCEEYGAEPREVLDALAAVQSLERDRTATLGAAGVEPFATFLARGDLDEFTAEARWLAERRDGLA
ncbi:MAG TPA: phosphotransferase [Phytomonospora sp.]